MSMVMYGRAFVRASCFFSQVLEGICKPLVFGRQDLMLLQAVSHGNLLEPGKGGIIGNRSHIVVPE